MKIIIGADIVPTKSNIELFKLGDTEALIGSELKKIISEADMKIFNLEVPLTKVVSPIKKHGPALYADPGSIQGLKGINPDFFTLANNHILDQGEEGLLSTVNLLREFGIAFAGAGQNSAEAAKAYIFCRMGIKIGIYCCTEHEFSIASENSAGANLFDPLESLEHISNLKSQCDYVIVLYHGGKEEYRYPSPYLQKVCRKIVDRGADFVICQHSHCIGCEEKRNNGLIVYGQGNFLFDDTDNEFWKTGLLIELVIEKSNTSVLYHPLIKKENTVRLADKYAGEKIINDFKNRSLEITDMEFVRQKYNIFAEEKITEYLKCFSGRNGTNWLLRFINKLSGYKFTKKYMDLIYREKERLALENFIECEAHRELLLAGIKRK